MSRLALWYHMVSGGVGTKVQGTTTNEEGTTSKCGIKAQQKPAEETESVTPCPLGLPSWEPTLPPRLPLVFLFGLFCRAQEEEEEHHLPTSI